MNSACKKWRNALLEAALSGAAAPELARHLEICPACSLELETLDARRVQLDQILPLVVKSAEPSPDFRARVLVATSAPHGESSIRNWRPWALAGAAALVLALSVRVAVLPNPSVVVSKDDLTAAQKLAVWRAPTDSLLSTPGRKFLSGIPTLGKSYLEKPARKNRED